MRVEFKKTVKADIDIKIVAEAVSDYIEEYILDAFDDTDIDTDDIPKNMKIDICNTVALEILQRNGFYEFD